MNRQQYEADKKHERPTAYILPKDNKGDHDSQLQSLVVLADIEEMPQSSNQV